MRGVNFGLIDGALNCWGKGVVHLYSFFHEVILLPSVYFLDCSIILDIFDRPAWTFLHKVLNAVLNGMALSDVLFTLFKLCFIMPSS